MAAERWKRFRACTAGLSLPGSTASAASSQIRATERPGLVAVEQFDLT
jgi:hypothetical protein